MKIPRNLGGHFLNIKEGKDWKGFGREREQEREKEREE